MMQSLRSSKEHQERMQKSKFRQTCKSFKAFFICPWRGVQLKLRRRYKNSSCPDEHCMCPVVMLKRENTNDTRTWGHKKKHRFLKQINKHAFNYSQRMMGVFKWWKHYCSLATRDTLQSPSAQLYFPQRNTLLCKITTMPLTLDISEFFS